MAPARSPSRGPSSLVTHGAFLGAIASLDLVARKESPRGISWAPGIGSCKLVERDPKYGPWFCRWFIMV